MQSFEYTYNLNNLNASVLDISNLGSETLVVMGGLIIGILMIIFLYQTCLYFYGYILVRREGKEKQAKKNTIQELILMKTIQDELEREIEESLLSSAFTQTPKVG